MTAVAFDVCWSDKSPDANEECGTLPPPSRQAPLRVSAPHRMGCLFGSRVFLSPFPRPAALPATLNDTASLERYCLMSVSQASRLLLWDFEPLPMDEVSAPPVVARPRPLLSGVGVHDPPRPVSLFFWPRESRV